MLLAEQRLWILCSQNGFTTLICTHLQTLSSRGVSHIPVEQDPALFSALLPRALTWNKKRRSFNLQNKLLRSSQDPASSKGAATASAALGLSSTYAGPALAKALQATVGCSSCQARFASASWKWNCLECPKKKMAQALHGPATARIAAPGDVPVPAQRLLPRSAPNAWSRPHIE